MKIPFLGNEKSESSVSEFEKQLDAEIDRIGVELAAIASRRAQVAADQSELDRLDGIDTATAQEIAGAETELRRQYDPLVEMDAPPDAKVNAQRRVRAARAARAKYVADRAACRHTRESIADRVQQLNTEEAERVTDLRAATRRKAVYRYAVALLGLRDRLEDPDLPASVAFPQGVFVIDADPGHIGENVPTRTIFRDHVLRSLAEDYPDILQAAAAENPFWGRDADGAIRAVEQHKQKCAASHPSHPPARWKPNPFNSWRP